MNKVYRKLKQKYKFKYDINAILSDLIYTRILDPCSKRSSFRTAHEFLEKPSYELHDVYRALDVLGSECDLIQADVYKNSHFLGKRNDKIFYCDCSNYYFEIEQEDGIKKYGKSKEHRPNPTQSIKKLKKEEKEWALSPQGFKRVSDDKPVDISKLPEDDKGLYYKDEPYTTKKLQQRLIITYSPKYALYQKSIRSKQIERAQAVLDSGNTKKNRRNPNNPARFIGTTAVTKEGETADIQHYLDEHKISEESQYDGLYAVCTDLLDDEVSDILKAMNFAEIQEQGFIALYKREAITDDLHEACGFRTDYQFITKSRMKTIQKKSKRKE